MTSRNQLHGEQLADKILTTVKIHLADFDGYQLDQLVAVAEAELRERDAIGNALDEEAKREGLNDT